jgi:Kdo2-lipid IVA lauroyltransferase/acyltransferase
LLRVFGALLGWLAGSVFRIRRVHVEDSMRIAGIARPSREARAMYASLGVSALEFLWMAMRGARALEHVVFDPLSRERWNDALGEGKGVVVAGSHTGNWDLAACAVAQEVELLVVTKRLRMAWLDRFWQSTRAALGVTLADADGAMARGRAVLRRGGAVAMMIDQVPLSSRHASRVEFLGRSAATDRAAAALAASARAPLVVITARRDPHGRHLLQVLDVLHPPSRPTCAWVVDATRSVTLALDRFVRAYPSQWLWLHRRWKPMLSSTLPCKSTPSSSPVAPSPAG